VGVESTVINSPKGRTPAAPGGTPETIEALIRYPTPRGGPDDGSTGARASDHYARALVKLVAADGAAALPGSSRPAGRGRRRPCAAEVAAGPTPRSRSFTDGDEIERAAGLFDALHRLDAAGLDRIAAQAVPETGLGRAIMDRLRRAAART
jgi:L-threonylcarbamoyladenylate synthase